jgi:glycosyltransferase involved in cell wall biosynthesis
VLVTATQVPFVTGGAELHVRELVTQLRRAGHDAEVVTQPFAVHSPDALLEAMVAARLMRLTESAGRPVDRLIVTKFPTYFAPHPNKVVWLMHQHRTAYELWDSPFSDLAQFKNGRAVRDAIREADRRLLPEAKRLFTTSRNVSQRLMRFSGLDSEPLYHPPPEAELLRCAPAKPYLYAPSRISTLKRQLLVVEALAHTTEPVRVRFAGGMESEEYRSLLLARADALGVSERIEWLGQVPAELHRQLYAECLGVVYPPRDEDYGYVTLEAMLSSKPVITCLDSGGTLEFVVHEDTGLVSAPTPLGLAAAMDQLWSERGRAAQWGRNGRARYDSLDVRWERVLERLLS